MIFFVVIVVVQGRRAVVRGHRYDSGGDLSKGVFAMDGYALGYLGGSPLVFSDSEGEVCEDECLVGVIGRRCEGEAFDVVPVGYSTL